eukprot:TRINITY_DN27264_c0_g2_i1.p1 TRINITY_DN27264_c0_g2~~TRINITY_DN27264_c0_g2_i1.p1  ORF type:complete len:117 (-),score=3.51 TRINITY_DN27264_c0_g2_i1:268-618(-)
MTLKRFFNPEVDFCFRCGALLPPFPSRGDIQCVVCKVGISVNDFKNTTVNYTVKFNKVQKPKTEVEGGEGPVIERTCPKCGNNQMSFATLQLRSADEGQTVFFTCTKCGFKETENS